jgi:dihydroorotate dehydrogenase electron transfer subunit
MIKDEKFTIEYNRQLNATVFEMRLIGDTSLLTNPGQFIDLAVSGKYLRRPISVSDYDGKGLTLVYKVVGEGTEIMSKMREGESINALIALGNGFSVDFEGKKVVLVGGGIGLPPMYNLAKELVKKGKEVTVVMGFNGKEDAFYLDKFDFCKETRVCTVDGSLGIKGFVTNAIEKGEFDYFCACGPEPMLNALLKTGMDGQLSYEARMGCGFGVCMGCSCKTKLGSKRICKDGPVMTAEEMR